MLCVLEQHSHSLTPRGGKSSTTPSLCPQGCAQHPVCKDPALLISTFTQGMQGVSTALGSLSGKEMYPKGWQQLLKPKWSLGVTCQSCFSGRDFLWGQNVSCPSGQHLAPAHTLKQARSCSPCQLQALSSVWRGSTGSCAETSQGPGLTLRHSTAPGGLAAPRIPQHPLPAPWDAAPPSAILLTLRSPDVTSQAPCGLTVGTGMHSWAHVGRRALGTVPCPALPVPAGTGTLQGHVRGVRG